MKQILCLMTLCLGTFAFAADIILEPGSGIEIVAGEKANIYCEDSAASVLVVCECRRKSSLITELIGDPKSLLEECHDISLDAGLQNCRNL